MSSNKYLVNKTTNKKYRLNGISPSTHLPSKNLLRQNFGQHILYGAAELPPKVDLRPDMTAVEDQSDIASCAGNALAGAYEYLLKKSEGRNIDVSRLFIYYNARTQDNDSGSVTDSGCTMTDAIEALEAKGVCLETTWPYDISKVNTRPSDEAYAEGQSYKINEALRVDINLSEMKSCLAQGFPFAFGLTLFESFDKATKAGIVPMPSSNDSSRSAHGFHAMLAVGYSDQSNAFIVRNSWGDDWGEHGYCYIPYDYITNSEYSFDVWTIRKISSDDFGKDSWHFNDTDKRSENVYYDDNNDNNDYHAIITDDNQGNDDYFQNDTHDQGHNDYFQNDSYDQGNNDYFRNDTHDQRNNDYSYTHYTEYKHYDYTQ